MSGCSSLSNSYRMNTNIVHEDHSPNINTNNFNFITHQNNYLNPPPNPINYSPIRRTLSAADMSSRVWLGSNGLALKKTHSSEQLQALGEENFDKHIQKIDDDKNKEKSDSGGAAFEDIWSSILSQKKLDEFGSGSGSGQLPPPYVHPLVKRSASSLSEKSLEICTESLGSETGSDGFSYPSDGDSDSKEGVEDTEIEVQQQEEQQQGTDKKCHVEEVRGFVEVAKYNYPVNKKTGPPKSFPPPLASLAHRTDGSNVHMRTERRDGRLVLEAVSVPSQNCFRAQRQGGRLLLIVTRVQDQKQEDQIESEDEEEIGEVEQESKGNVEEMVVEKKSNMTTNGGVINVQRSSTASIMSKLIELTSTRNSSTWPRNFNKTVIKTLDHQEVVGARQKVEAHSLPPRPRMSTATAAEVALNAYEYYWRSPTVATVAVLKPLAGKQKLSKSIAYPQVVKENNDNNNKKNNNNKINNSNNKLLLGHDGKGGAQEVVLVKAAAVGGVAGEKREYLVPLLRGCKEPRRSLLFWEPYCIATS